MQGNCVHAYGRISALSKLLVLFSLIATMTAFTPAAIAQSGNPATEDGFKPFGSFDNTAIDSVNLVNLHVNLHIPLGTYSQRGKMFPSEYHLAYFPNNLVPQNATYPCLDFGLTGCGEVQCQDPHNLCDVTVPLGQYVTAELYVGSDSGFGRVGGLIESGDSNYHEVAIVPSRNGLMTLDTSGFFDNNELGGDANELPETVWNSNGISLGLYPTNAPFSDPSGNTIGSADTIGRSLEVTSATTDFSGCTGPLTTVGAFIVSLPSIQYKICYANYYVSPNYQMAYDYSYGGTEPAGSWTIYQPYTFYPPVTAMQSIVLPNSAAYTFYYDGYATIAAAQAANAYGDLVKIALPTGGSISYTWSDPVYPAGGFGCLALVFSRMLRSRSVDANDGTGPHTWTYNMTQGPGFQQVFPWDYPYNTIVTDPSGNDTVHTFKDIDMADNSCMYYETNTQYYQGSSPQIWAGAPAPGSLLKTVATEYNYSTWVQFNPIIGNEGYRHPIDIVPHTVATSYPDGSGIRKTFTYDAGYPLADNGGNPVAGAYGILGNVISESDVDLSTNQTIQTITNSYKTDSAYINAGLMRLLSSTTITDGAGHTASQTSYNYDESPSPQGAYGNLTSVTKTVNDGGATLTWKTVYNSQGMPVSTYDPRPGIVPTTTTYDTTGLYPAQVQRPTTNGISHTDYYSYDSNTSNLLYHTDENGSSAGDSTHTTTYSYSDPLHRLTQVQYPPTESGQGTISTSYNDATLTMTTTTLSTPDPTITTTQIFDGLGRSIQTTGSDGSITKTTYDALGRVASVSNPYFLTSDLTYGITQYTYDALGRETVQTNPDSTVQQTCYDNTATTGQTNCHTHIVSSVAEWVDSADEAGNNRQTTFDALGRMTSVVEPGGIQTNYTYNLLGNLIRINQPGISGETPRIDRTFTYDWLSRLVCSSNPENSSNACPSSPTAAMPSGVTIYGYDPNGNLITKTDARGASTAYTYDALNRVTGKTYTLGSSGAATTLASCYSYDTGPSGITGGNFIGRLVQEWTIAGTSCASTAPTTGYQTLRSILQYDSMGRIQSEQQCHGSTCTTGTPYTTTLHYDLAGNPISYTNGIQSITLTSGYDAAGRLQNLSSSWADGTHPGMLFSGTTYTPASALQNFTLGIGLNATRTYDNRLRPTSESVTQPQ